MSSSSVTDKSVPPVVLRGETVMGWKEPVKQASFSVLDDPLARQPLLHAESRVQLLCSRRTRLTVVKHTGRTAKSVGRPAADLARDRGALDIRYGALLHRRNRKILG